MKKEISIIGMVGCFLFAHSILNAQNTHVANVRFEDRGKTISIQYDLIGKPGKKFKISLSLSDDYGKTFAVRPRTVTGDAGKNVESGTGKEIVWYFKEDFPGGLSGSGFLFAMDAELQKSGKKWPYILGGGRGGRGGVFRDPGQEKVRTAAHGVDRR
jgi:hypothetical protein